MIRRLRRQWADLPLRRKLRESETGFHSLAQSAVDAVITADEAGRIVFWNDAASRVFGYAPGEVSGQPLAMLMPERYRDAHLRALARISAGGDPRLIGRTLELEGLRKDGSEFPLLLSLSSWVASGRRYYSAIVRDVTDAKRAEAESRRAERLLDSIIENMPLAFYMKDAADLRLVRMNRAAEEILGVERAQMLGGRTTDLFGPEEAARITADDRRVLETGEVLDIEETLLLTARGQRIVHTRKMAIVDDAGVPQRLVGIAEDITERKLAEARLKAAHDDADRANRAKSEFLSRMSHDLRTPLNAIIGFAQLLDLEAQTPDQRDAVIQIIRGGRHLLALINEVLDLARIEAGQMCLSPEPVAVDEVVRHALELVTPLAAQRDIQLDGRQIDACGVYVRADRQRLAQVLLNLLSNAVKYNRDGGRVTVTCQRAGDALQIHIADTGPGIAPALLQRLFTPFERLGADPAIEGTGLGLALCKQLAAAMGGRIGVESEVGRGSTFWIEMPVAAGPVRPTEREPRPAVSRHAEGDVTGTVLYIEDNPSNLRLIERVIGRRPKVTLLTALQGGIGVDLARSRRPDLIFLDMHLPDMSGAEVFQRLHAYPETADVPIVILSADATPRQIERQLAAGARAYLTKPLDINEVLALVDETLKRRTPGTGRVDVGATGAEG